MLNEYIEFKEYTSELGISKIKSFNFNKNVSIYGRIRFKGNNNKDEQIYKFPGFERILTIIARGYYYHNVDENMTAINKDQLDKSRIENVEKALLSYLSIDVNDSNLNFSQFNKIFPNLVDKNGQGLFIRYLYSVKDFYEKILNSKTFDPELRKLVSIEIKKITSTILYLKFEIKELIRDPFSKKYKFYTNLNYNQYFLKTIIARAINEGPLKNKILFINKIKFRELLKKHINGEKILARHYMLFALFFYFLVNSQDGNFISINNYDFINWLNTTKFPDEIIIFQKRNTLGLEYKLINKTRKLIRFDNQLIKSLDYFIDDETNNLKINKNYFTFEDLGMFDNKRKNDLLSSIKKLMS